MGITDELRHEVANYPFRGSMDFALFEGIADRIDAEHENAMYNTQREFEEWKHTQDTCYVNCMNDCTNSKRTGTCKADKLCDGYLYYTGYWCRGCDERFAYTPIGGKNRGASPKFCPNCGARIVDPMTNDVDVEVSA